MTHPSEAIAILKHAMTLTHTDSLAALAAYCHEHDTTPSELVKRS